MKYLDISTLNGIFFIFKTINFIFVDTHTEVLLHTTKVGILTSVSAIV